VAAHALLHVVGLLVMRAPIRRGLSDVLPMAFLMLGPCQATLLALWTVLGDGTFLWRVLLVVLVLALQGCFETPDVNWRIITFGQLCVSGMAIGHPLPYNCTFMEVH